MKNAAAIILKDWSFKYFKLKNSNFKFGSKCISLIPLKNKLPIFILNVFKRNEPVQVQFCRANRVCQGSCNVPARGCLSLWSSALRLRLTTAKKLGSFCKSNYTPRIRHELVGACSS